MSNPAGSPHHDKPASIRHRRHAKRAAAAVTKACSGLLLATALAVGPRVAGQEKPPPPASDNPQAPAPCAPAQPHQGAGNVEMRDGGGHGGSCYFHTKRRHTHADGLSDLLARMGGPTPSPDEPSPAAHRTSHRNQPRHRPRAVSPTSGKRDSCDCGLPGGVR